MNLDYRFKCLEDKTDVKLAIKGNKDMPLTPETMIDLHMAGPISELGNVMSFLRMLMMQKGGVGE